MNYLLDTNIVLIYTRNSDITNSIEEKYDLFNPENELYISVVTVAELKSIILQKNYGERKIKTLEHLLSKFSIIDINIVEILDQYAQIDAYSQGKLKGKPSNFSARNMGKNDLFIAATAGVYDLLLVTTDNDFKHLSPDYLRLEKVDIEAHKRM